MSNTSRMSVFPLGMSIATFFAITYILCISYGVLVSSQGMHQLFQWYYPASNGSPGRASYSVWS